MFVGTLELRAVVWVYLSNTYIVVALRVMFVGTPELRVVVRTYDLPI
jgi:hypothetical protein